MVTRSKNSATTSQSTWRWSWCVAPSDHWTHHRCRGYAGLIGAGPVGVRAGWITHVRERMRPGGGPRLDRTPAHSHQTNAEVAADTVFLPVSHRHGLARLGCRRVVIGHLSVDRLSG